MGNAMTGHLVPVRLYVAVFAALVCFTALTTWVAFVDLGAANTFIALTIAFVKATLVLLYFMHVRWSSRLTAVFIGVGFLFLATMIGLTMTDVLSRGWLGVPGG
jgi:cytochrome c oxidase subunit 4